MKIAVLGKGKTGSKVIEVLSEQKIDYTIFDSTHLLDAEKLKGHDAVVSFLSSEPFTHYLPLLIASKIPVISGTTGFHYSEALHTELVAQKTKWIVANNFSLGMNLVQKMIHMMGKASLLIENPHYQIHEVHHTKKLDAPSGTALSFKHWLGPNIPVEITSERTGDVIGLHELKLTTKTEEITLTHNALDRKIFAEGAVWALHKILNSPMANGKAIPYGINSFQDIVSHEIF